MPGFFLSKHLGGVGWGPAALLSQEPAPPGTAGAQSCGLLEGLPRVLGCTGVWSERTGIWPALLLGHIGTGGPSSAG